MRAKYTSGDSVGVRTRACGDAAPLVELVKSGAPGAQEQAARALRNLAANNAANQEAIAAAGGIAPLVDLSRAASRARRRRRQRGVAVCVVSCVASAVAVTRAVAVAVVIAIVTATAAISAAARRRGARASSLAELE